MTYPAGQPYQQQQPYGGGYPPPCNTDSGLAIGALVFSVLGVFTLLPAFPGIILGHVAFAKARRGQAGGKVLAIVAFTLGYLAVIAWAIAIPVLFNVAAKHGAFR